ncbi:MAG: tRNA (adenosine(37)-N6)-threonylcarbamoyltransferase complex dimerization subunit type 1 TsaB [Ignavibacteria bacterium]|nr:tRNA (adenosine(37)-N6)-threonylcarbamoyltransferase complex dimerization subunit type 1 TsaB [Ignavibacteria bacterium]
MNILLIDSTFKKIEFAYNKNGNFVILDVLNSEKNADGLIYEIKKAFDSHGFSLNDVDYIGLSNGPGSFTGVRIGSAIAKGICFAGRAKLVELVSLDILANKYKEVTEGMVLMPLIFSYSKSKDFYTAEYRLSERVTKRISDYRVISLSELKKDRIYLINEKTETQFSEGYTVKDLSDISGAESMYELTMRAINENRIADYVSSEPFYMKTITG